MPVNGLCHVCKANDKRVMIKSPDAQKIMCSDRSEIQHGVSQESLFGVLLFVLHVTELQLGQ